jgi:beta-1,4-mannosyltransferase
LSIALDVVPNSLHTSGSIGRQVRVAVYPRMTRPAHPYFTAFHAALGKQGIATSDPIEIDARWVAANARRVNAIHLHWPESIWRGHRFGQAGRIGRAVRAGRSLLQLSRFLRAARRAAMKRIWTVHNLEPHEGAYRWDRYGYRLLAREADLIVCHSEWSAAMVRRDLRPRGRLLVMPMGELASACPPARPRHEVLRELGLDPQAPLVSCLGRLRDYKGLDLACDAVERIDGRIQLVIGGVRQTGFDLAPFMQAARRTPRIAMLPRKLTDQELADLTAASDAVLLPYRKITGSAALLSALGFGCGVITSDLPYFREILAPEPDAGAIVPTRDPAVWAAAIVDFLARDPDARRKAALRLADRYAWDRSVYPLASLLHEWSDGASTPVTLGDDAGAHVSV